MTETPTKTRAEGMKTETVTVAPARGAKADEPVTIREVFDLPKESEKDLQPNRWQVVEERIKKEVKDVKFPAALHVLPPLRVTCTLPSSVPTQISSGFFGDSQIA